MLWVLGHLFGLPEDMSVPHDKELKDVMRYAHASVITHQRQSHRGKGTGQPWWIGRKEDRVFVALAGVYDWRSELAWWNVVNCEEIQSRCML